MARAKRKNTAESAKTADERSEIIEQCVVYVQSRAAYEAGFKADHTGEGDYAGAGAKLGKRHLRKAQRALLRLITLIISPTDRPGRPPLSKDELFAKARVLQVISMPKGDDPVEGAYVRFFALEVEDYLRAAA